MPEVIRTLSGRTYVTTDGGDSLREVDLTGTFSSEQYGPEELQAAGKAWDDVAAVVFGVPRPERAS